jgi:hypothetical protein
MLHSVPISTGTSTRSSSGAGWRRHSRAYSSHRSSHGRGAGARRTTLGSARVMTPRTTRRTGADPST